MLPRTTCAGNEVSIRVDDEGRAGGGSEFFARGGLAWPDNAVRGGALELIGLIGQVAIEREGVTVLVAAAPVIFQLGGPRRPVWDAGNPSGQNDHQAPARADAALSIASGPTHAATLFSVRKAKPCAI